MASKAKAQPLLPATATGTLWDQLKTKAKTYLSDDRDDEQGRLDRLLDCLPNQVGGAWYDALRRWRVSHPGEPLRWQDIDLPQPLKLQLLDACTTGTWRGDWVPMTPAELDEAIRWLERNNARLRSLGIVVPMGNHELDCWNLLIKLRAMAGPRKPWDGYDDWQVVRAVQKLRADHPEPPDMEPKQPAALHRGGDQVAARGCDSPPPAIPIPQMRVASPEQGAEPALPPAPRIPPRPERNVFNLPPSSWKTFRW
jgi:hypothetical protein